MSIYSLGWKKDKYDPRDYIHKPKLIVLPDKVILGNLPYVRHQMNVGSCVGHAIGANVTSITIREKVYTEWFSPTWIYNGARFLTGFLNEDSGCYPKDALDWLKGNGCLLERFWPYNPDKLDTSPPSSERMAQAFKYDNFTYYRVDNSLTGIMSALSEGHLVTIGSPWFTKWFSPIDGVLDEAVSSDEVAGGHETLLYGYDNSVNKLFGMNSWGTDWGKNGFFEMPFSAINVFKQLWGYDAHYITFDPSIPPLPPEPTPSECSIGNGICNVLNKIQSLRKRRGRFYYLNPS